MVNKILEHLNFFDNEELYITCVSCGGENLHHEIIDVHNRGGDSNITRTTRVYGKAGEATTPNVDKHESSKYISENNIFLTVNPSPRRDGISIIFSCEICSELTIMQIFQHKGTSHITISLLEK